MIRTITKMILTLIFVTGFTYTYAQTTISGNITDELTGEPLIGVNVLVKGTVLGTISNVNGDFSLTTSSNPPFSLVISYVGYERQEVEITGGISNLSISLSEETLLGQEVVVSASRIEESTLKSPVSVERMDILDIQNSANADFYGALKNLNGVDFSTQSLTFKSVNARGFGANGNTRFVQLIDGIDNQAPGLNFPVGNAIGISELDLESIEMIPGAASALYGPNAIQGILLMKSKSPFDYQGLDIYSKLGVNHIDGEDDDMALYKDLGLRYAKAFNDKFAFKLNVSWLNAQDFRGVDYRDQSGATIEGNLESTRQNNRFYDGINTYGEFVIDIGTIADIASADPATAASLAPIRSLLPNGINGAFTPTGYRERDFIDNTTESLKLGAALHYRITDKIEALGQFNYGLGSSVYTANDRFILDNFVIWTGKAELRGANWYLRAYTTQESSGDSYAANTLAQRINQQFYLTPYFSAYVDRVTGLNSSGTNPDLTQIDPTNYAALHAEARAFADALQPAADSPEFQEAAETIRNTSIAAGGAKFLDKTALYHYEGSYNFQNEIDFVDVVVGGNYRTFALNSEGTLFALDDNGEEISFNEFGGYVQLSKDIIDNLRLQGSVRYDKNQNFAGQFSPRISGVWEFLAGHNLRASFQRGFRMPTTQDQYIDLDVVTRRLLGRNEIIANRYNLNTNPVYYTTSVEEAQASGDVSRLQIADDAYKEYKTEKVSTYEVGYKGLLLDGRLLIDAFYYYNVYSDFGAEIDVTQAVAIVNGQVQLTGASAIPNGYNVGSATPHAADQQQVFVTGGAEGIALQRYGYDTNIDEDIESFGYGLGLEYTIGNGYTVGANASYNELKSLNDIVARNYNVAFNTPEWRYNIKFGNRKLTDRVGFNLAYRWQDAYLWSSAIGDGIVPAFGTLDAQVTYKVPSLNARVKVGGTNILNERYTTSLANPRLGAIYYIQLNFDNILNSF